MPKPSYRWIVVYVLAWPVLLVGITWLRFGKDFFSNSSGLEISGGILAFALLGLVSGWLNLRYMRKAGGRPGRTVTLVGYLIASPFAFVAALLGPLASEALYSVVSIPSGLAQTVVFPIFATIAGLIWLFPATLLGFAIGNRKK